MEKYLSAAVSVIAARNAMVTVERLRITEL